MKRFFGVVLAAALLYPALCAATTWAEAKVKDPINPRAKCKVHEPMSSGGYIYHWPDKYDQAFWPHTDPQGIWFCEKTGFTAFMGDFEKISPAEKARIADYLRTAHQGGDGIENRLRLLEGTYALRDTDDAFKIMLLRVLARWYQNLDQLDKANTYRRSALSMIEQRLGQELPEAQRLEYLYIAANYSRLFGDAESSDKRLAELRDAIGKLKDENATGYAQYLSELAKETPRIKPGGKLDPERNSGADASAGKDDGHGHE